MPLLWALQLALLQYRVCLPFRQFMLHEIETTPSLVGGKHIGKTLGESCLPLEVLTGHSAIKVDVSLL